MEKRSTRSSTCKKEPVTLDTNKFSVSQHCDTNIAGVRNYAMIKGMHYAGWPLWYFGSLTSIQQGTKFPLSPSCSIPIFLRLTFFRLGYATGGTQRLSQGYVGIDCVHGISFQILASTRDSPGFISVVHKHHTNYHSHLLVNDSLPTLQNKSMSLLMYPNGILCPIYIYEK